jgi:hypothetical protein
VGLEVFGLLLCYFGNGAIGSRARTTVCIHFFDGVVDLIVVWWWCLQWECLVFDIVYFFIVVSGGDGGGGF